MISFVQQKSGVEELFYQIAAAAKLTVTGKRINIPPASGSGYMQLEKLPNGLRALIMNYCFNDDLYYERPPGSKEFYTLRSREAEIKKTIITTIDQEEAKEPPGKHKSLYLTSSFFDLSYFISKGTQVSAVQIELSTEWMAKYLHMDVYDDILKEYLSLKIKMLDAVIMDADYTTTQQEILSVDSSHPAELTILHNRIMHIVERFFSELYEHRKQLKYRIRCTAADIDAIISMEARLTENLKIQFPTISQLAKEAGMSPSKLKTLFKKVYGKAIYEYYQEQRMQKAKAMLLSGNFAVKEAAMEIGFKNLSNFSLAFKKQFNSLPTEFIK